MFVRASDHLLSLCCSSIITKNGSRGYATVREALTYKLKYRKNVSQETHMKRRANITAKFQELQTIEEKLFALNMPRYYGFKSLILREDSIPWGSLKAVQYLTQTHVASDTYLPREIESIEDENVNEMLPSIQNTIEDSILFENSGRLRQHELNDKEVMSKAALENIFANAIIYHVNRTMLNHLGDLAKYPYLKECTLDYEPRIEAFWYNTGMDPPSYIRKEEKKFPDKDYLKGQDYELPIQYVGSPVLQLRHNCPLNEIWSEEEMTDNQDQFDVPQYTYCPKVAGFMLERRRATIVPGFWPGDAAEYGLMSYHNRGYMLDRQTAGADDHDVLKAQAILASYGWLLGQACYQGFTPFNDLTYPLITQTVITNGQWWSFCAYQLNTMVLQDKFYQPNRKTNLLWITPPMKLYDEIADNKVIGFNDDVIKTLAKLYMNIPEARKNINMKPYLPEANNTIAGISQDERRVWLEKHYKHLVSNRPRHRRVPEIPDWQRIYFFRKDIRYPSVKKRDPWQFGVNPMRRMLNDHKKPYVPKCLRKNPKLKKVGRHAATYYPFE